MSEAGLTSVHKDTGERTPASERSTNPFGDREAISSSSLSTYSSEGQGQSQPAVPATAGLGDLGGDTATEDAIVSFIIFA